MQKHRDEAELAARIHAQEMADLRQATKERLEQIRCECETSIRAAQDSLAVRVSELEELRRVYDDLLEEKRVAEARIKALGGIVDDYTSRERFNELEREYNAFREVYRKQWEITKKSIKKRHLSINNLKAQKEKKKDEEDNDVSDSN
jgi:hypothetical protein